MQKPNSIPRDVRIPIVLAAVSLMAMLVNFRWGFSAALLSGGYGWMIGLISFPMKRWRRMFACFGLIAYCILLVWLASFFYFPEAAI